MIRRSSNFIQNSQYMIQFIKIIKDKNSSKISKQMDIDQLNAQQMEKAFKLCDIMSIEDLYVATTILQNYGWNIEVQLFFNDVQKALDEINYSKQQQKQKAQLEQKQWSSFKPKQSNLKVSETVSQNQQQNQKKHSEVNKNKQQKQQKEQKQAQGKQINTNRNYGYYIEFSQQDNDPYMDNFENDQEIDYADYQYDYAETDVERKKQMFEQNYPTQIPFNKTISQPNSMIKSLEKDKNLAENYQFHRHQYQNNLYKKSEQLCQKILGAQNPQNHKVYRENKRKIQTNKKFIVFLHKHYSSRINFTFGTFLLNLIRSYLDDKYLLVFLHSSNNHEKPSKVVQSILHQKQIASFINKNCVSYGMFDNSDDYQIVQKYVPLKDFPAFALFKYDRKAQKEQFISSYPLLNKQNQNCLEWLAQWMGIVLKKKEITKKSQQKIKSQKQLQYKFASDLLKDQNEQYEEMEKLYKMRRLESRMNKEKLQEKKKEIQNLRKHFEQNPEPSFVQGETIEIKFRMPVSGQSKIRNFSVNDQIQKMFDYIECYHQQDFQQPYCEFDLTQTFPHLSLKDQKSKTIKELFPDSERENIIIKEI